MLPVVCLLNMVVWIGRELVIHPYVDAMHGCFLPSYNTQAKLTSQEPNLISALLHLLNTASYYLMADAIFHLKMRSLTS